MNLVAGKNSRHSATYGRGLNTVGPNVSCASSSTKTTGVSGTSRYWKRTGSREREAGNKALHCPGRPLRLSLKSPSFQSARQVNAVIIPQRRKLVWVARLSPTKHDIDTVATTLFRNADGNRPTRSSKASPARQKCHASEEAHAAMESGGRYTHSNGDLGSVVINHPGIVSISRGRCLALTWRVA